MKTNEPSNEYEQVPWIEDLGAVHDENSPESSDYEEIHFLGHLEIEEVISRRLQNESAKNNIRSRRRLSETLLAVTVCWMLMVLVIVTSVGKRYLLLSDTVLITLITSTTANVFGFLYVVVNYLFNKEKST